MIILLTDFGISDPYVGQMRYAIAQRAPLMPVLDLFHCLPNFEIQAAAYLVEAYTQQIQGGDVVIGVVDPGVGSQRAGLILRADGRYFVGPDNGLFDRVAINAAEVEAWHIQWRPSTPLSASFHGRDWFAPVAAQLATGRPPEELGSAIDYQCQPWPEQLARVIYIDHYGNAISGVKASSLQPQTEIKVGHYTLRRARTFSDLPEGEAFWYENANGLVEVAVNCGSAADTLTLHLGQSLLFYDPST